MHDSLPTPRPNALLPERRDDFWERFARRDPKAVSKVVQPLFPLICYHLSRNGCKAGLVRQEAEELQQVILAELLPYPFEGSNRTEADIPKVLRGFIRKAWARRRRELHKKSMAALPDALLARLVDDSPRAIEAMTAYEQLHVAVVAAFEQELQPDCRELLGLAYLEKHTRRMIARQLERTERQVKYQLLKCREHLLDATKKCLEVMQNRSKSIF